MLIFWCSESITFNAELGFRKIACTKIMYNIFIFSLFVWCQSVNLVYTRHQSLSFIRVETIGAIAFSRAGISPWSLIFFESVKQKSHISIQCWLTERFRLFLIHSPLCICDITTSISRTFLRKFCDICPMIASQ